MKKTGHRPTDLAYLHVYFSQETSYLRLLTNVAYFSETWSDTFRSVLIYEMEEQDS